MTYPKKTPRRHVKIVNGHRYRTSHNKLVAEYTPGCHCQGCDRKRAYAAAQAKSRRSLVVTRPGKAAVARMIWESKHKQDTNR